MPAKLPDSWWFARVVIHPVPETLWVQLRVVVTFFVLMYGLPAAADLAFSRGVYANSFSPPEMIFALSSSAALLTLFWYFTRVEGGSWAAFWNHKPSANIWCVVLVPLVLALSQGGSDLVFDALQKRHPDLAQYCSPRSAIPSPFPWELFLPTTLAYAMAEEAIARGLVITRVRQIGGGLLRAVLLSTMVYGSCQLGFGLNVFAAALVSGVILAVVYARWGGLAGFILGRVAWECSNYIKL